MLSEKNLSKKVSAKARKRSLEKKKPIIRSESVRYELGDTVQTPQGKGQVMRLVSGRVLVRAVLLTDLDSVSIAL